MRPPNYIHCPNDADRTLLWSVTLDILCKEQFFVTVCSSQVGKAIQFLL